MANLQEIKLEPKNGPSGIPSFLGAILVALVPPIVILSSFHASQESLAIGAVAWVAALSMKTLASGFINRLSKSRDLKKTLSILQGLLSSFTELGIPAICFIPFFQSIPLVDVVAFGVGASSIEALFTFFSGIVSEICKPDHSAQAVWVSRARQSLCVQYMIFLERFGALLGHVGSRGLVYLGLANQAPCLIVIAFITFSLTDGVAAYGIFNQWDWFNPRVCRSFHLFLLGVSFFEIGLFTIIVMHQ